MKKAILFIAPFLYLSSPAQRTLEVNYAKDTKGNYVFSCVNHAFCNYVLKVEFTTLNNASADQPLPFVGEVKPGYNKLFTVTPGKGPGDFQMNYKASNRKGCLTPSVNNNITYLLPVGPGQNTQAYVVGTPTADSAYPIRLRMKPGDTIYAARRGTVTAVDVSNTDNDPNGSWNSIEIVQGDCTFAQYGIFKKDGAFVKPGQFVEAGTPLGIVGGDRYGRGTEARFSVSNLTNNGSALVPTIFWTKESGKTRLRQGAFYTSEFPKNILSQELPKAKPATKKPKK